MRKQAASLTHMGHAPGIDHGRKTIGQASVCRSLTRMGLPASIVLADVRVFDRPSPRMGRLALRGKRSPQ